MNLFWCTVPLADIPETLSYSVAATSETEALIVSDEMVGVCHGQEVSSEIDAREIGTALESAIRIEAERIESVQQTWSPLDYWVSS